MDTKNIALEYLAAGLTCIPCIPGKKRPAVGWKQFQTRPATEQDIDRLFYRSGLNLAVITGMGSRNLYILDIETPDLYEKMKAELFRLGCKTWCVKTHRGGHIYLFSRHPIRSRSYKKLGYEVKGQGNYCLAPPSLHPSRTRYEFEHKPAQIALLDALPFLPHPLEIWEDTDRRGNPPSRSQSRSRRNSRIQEPAPESPEVNDYNGEPALEPPDPLKVKECHEVFRTKHEQWKNKYSPAYGYSELDGSVMLTLCNKGFDYNTIKEAFLTAFDTLGIETKFHRLWKLSPEEAWCFLRGEFQRAKGKEHSQEYLENIEIGERLLKWVQENPLKGPRAKTAMQALIGHAEKFKKCKKSDYDLSLREGAILSHCSKQTFCTGTKNLIQYYGYLKRVNKGNRRDRRSATYQFTSKLLRLLQNQTHTHKKSVCMCLDQQYKETCGVFERVGLGFNAGRIWFALQHGELLSKTEIARRTKVGLSTVSRLTGTMLSYDVIVEIVNPGGKARKLYTANTECDFKALGEHLGTTLVAHYREQGYKKERRELDRRREQEEILKATSEKPIDEDDL